MGSSSLLSSSTSPCGIWEGVLKLVLRLELPLLERPGRFPVENDGRRGDEGSTGDGDAGGGEGAAALPKLNSGISIDNLFCHVSENSGHQVGLGHAPPSTWSSSAL